MRTLAGVTSDSQHVDLEISRLILRESWLSGAKLVPPLPLVNKLLSSGSGRYDHWREVRWSPLVIDSATYTEITEDLCNRYNFAVISGYESCDDRVFWEAIQTAEQTGKSVELVYPALRRIGTLEKLIAILQDEDSEDQNVDISEFLALKLSEAVQSLQEL